MRAIVFIDLLSTIIAPVTVAYVSLGKGLCENETWHDDFLLQLGYLLYIIISAGGTIPTLSIIMLAAIYGLQALIFIFRLRWDMIAWMLCEC
jgi:chitin synthase